MSGSCILNVMKNVRENFNAKFLQSLTLLIVHGISGMVYGSSPNQTSHFSPIAMDYDLPYRIKIEQADFALPAGVHSFAWAEYEGKWLILAGRTNGMHGFNSPPFTKTNENFPVRKQNEMVFVVDPKTKTTFYKSLADYRLSGLTPEQVETLTVTSPQSYQSGKKLYITGGYGINYRTGKFETKETLSAIDVPGLMKWVTDSKGHKKAAPYIRQIQNPVFKVTGGYMTEIEKGSTLLVFGQNFSGQYAPGTSNGTYTEQVRVFSIEDGKHLKAHIKNPQPKNPDPNFRRRDLNVLPVLHYNKKGELESGLVAFSGVFTEEGGIWTVPVEIKANGKAFMANPADSATFKQAMNNYTSATVGLFSEKSGEMQNILLGGISYKLYENGEFKPDAELPFINQVTSLNIDKEGHYQQFLMNQEYPKIPVIEGPNAGEFLRFGAGAQLFLPEGLPTFANGVIKVDQLKGDSNLIGYIVGGIQSQLPNTNTMLDSSASSHIFKVLYLRVPLLNHGEVKEVSTEDLGSLAEAYLINNATLKTTAPVNSPVMLTVKKGGLTFDTNGFNSILKGVIRGNGSFKKVGEGGLTLSGDSSSYAGNVKLETGSLTISDEGKLGGTLFVKQNAALRGTGKVDHLRNSGIVFPGDLEGGRYGTLVVKKDYQQSKNGAFIVELEENANAALQVEGHAELDGILFPLITEIPSTGNLYTILSASSRSGKFSIIDPELSPTLFFEPHYLPNAVTLEVKEDYLLDNLAKSLTSNQRAVGKMLNQAAISPSDDLKDLLRLINHLSSNDQVGLAYSKLIPFYVGAQSTIAFANATLQTDNMVRRMHQLREASCHVNLKGFYPFDSQNLFSQKVCGDCEEEGDYWGTFLTARGVFGDQKRTAHEVGYDFKSSGISFGVDYALLKQVTLGLMGGYNSADASLGQSSGRMRLNESLVGVYGTADYGQFFCDALFTYGWNEYRNRRHLDFANIKRKAHSKHEGRQYTLYGDVGYTYCYSNWIVEPSLSLQSVTLNIDKYREHGGQVLNLGVKEQRARSFQGGLGGTIKYLWSTRVTEAMVSVNASWVHEFANNSRAVKAHLLQSPDSQLTIHTNVPGRNFAVLGAGVSTLLLKNVMLYLNYDAEVGMEHFVAQGINGGLRMEF